MMYRNRIEKFQLRKVQQRDEERALIFSALYFDELWEHRARLLVDT